MSSILLTGIPTAAGQVSHSAQQTQADRGGAGGAQQQIVSNSLTSGQATIVSLSGNNRSRTASNGDGRAVDATFDKQEIKGKSEKDKNGKQSAKATNSAVDVSA